MLFISPPFGNYFNFPKTIPIKGSFTYYQRPGKWSQIFKTLRFDESYGGWRNKIGLRNPGIDHAIQNYKKGTIVSIAIMNKWEIKPILKKIPDDMDIELNVSCPNTDKHMISSGLKPFLNKKRNWCIIKLSPIESCLSIDRYYKEGFRQFHASNTLPTEKGGISGPVLKSYTIGTIKYIKGQWDDTVVIAGGGIRTLKDIKEYQDAGADHFSISTLCFDPISFLNFYFEYTNQF